MKMTTEGCRRRWLLSVFYVVPSFILRLAGGQIRHHLFKAFNSIEAKKLLASLLSLLHCILLHSRTPMRVKRDFSTKSTLRVDRRRRRRRVCWLSVGRDRAAAVLLAPTRERDHTHHRFGCLVSISFSSLSVYRQLDPIYVFSLSVPSLMSVQLSTDYSKAPD